jgi:hypothetical protein
MVEVSNLLEKIIDPMAIMIRVIGLIARCFYFYENFSIFLEYPLKILSGFT